MKNLFAPLLSLFIISNVFAQEPCATTMPDDMVTWLHNYKANNAGPYYSKSSTDGITYLPVKVHIAGNDLGGGYYKFSTLLDAFCTLNDQYRPYNWQFYIYEDINYIDSEVLNQHQQGYTGIISSNSVPNVINMFFVDDPNGACGYFAGFGGPSTPGTGQRQGYIAINNSCGQDENSTIAHELGHFFSLPHTFSGWEGRAATAAPRSTDERANGSNCGTAGDRFCDTPADFISDRWNCPYTLTKNDFLGNPYAPDGALYMSYANDACQNYHSQEQLDAMRSYLADERDYLLSINFPNYPIIVDTAKTIYPPTGATGIPANYVNLKWKSVAGATNYLLEATRSNNPNILAIDTIVTDTSMIFTDLDPGFTYRWRVRAFNKYSTCSPYTIYSSFVTKVPTSLNPQINIDPITCAGSFDGSISLNINGGQGPYNFSWADGSTTSSLTFLEEGSYQVTVTDNSNESLVLNIDIADPDSLKVELVVTGNNLVAQTSGGTAPYSFNWSTGGNGAAIQPTPGGTYSVTITDNNGCSTVKTYSLPVGLNQIDAASSLRVYPNPTAGATSFSVALTVPQALTGTIEVIDNAGRMVYNTKQNFASGLNVTQVPLAQLSPGVYFVRVVSQDVVKTTKLLVY